MKTLEEILGKNPGFGPSRQTKDLILNSIKVPTTHLIGQETIETPGFFSYNLKKYSQYSIIIFLIYLLELFAIISIGVTTSTIFYTATKLVIIFVLVYLDIVVAKHNRSKDDRLIFHSYTKRFFSLMREFYLNLLNKKGLMRIEEMIKKHDAEIKNIKRFTNKMFIILFLLAFVKIFIFYLDFLFEGFSWTTIMARDPGYIISFFGAPIVYLIIPFLVWTYYGKWIWTGIAEKSLNKENKIHQNELKEAQKVGFGKINYCFQVFEKRPITHNNLIENLKDVTGDDSDNGYVQITHNIDLKTISKYNFNITKDESGDYYFNIYGILSDDDLHNIIAMQTNFEAQKLLLLLGMSYQIIICQGINVELELSKLQLQS